MSSNPAAAPAPAAPAPAATAAAAPSSPPQSPPPTTQHAGPRATALETAFARALDATLSKVSHDNFAACFPTAAANRPETVRAFWRDFVERLRAVCQRQFEAVLADRGVVAALNALDRLVGEARARREAGRGEGEVPVPPHTLPPDALLTAHLSPFLHEQQTLLATALTALETENVRLAEVIAEQRGEMEKLVAGLEATVRDVEKAAAMVQDGGVMDGLGGQIREMETQLRAA